MIYNITCLVCVTVMLVGRMLVPGVYDGIITSTGLDAVDTVAGSLRGENSTRESIPRHKSDNSNDRYNSIHDDYPEYMPRLYFFKYMHSI
jgi:hypothetical protein